MINLNINQTKVLFSKFFNEKDLENVLKNIADNTKSVLFVDTGATPILAELIEKLQQKNIRMFVRDHHKGEGRNPESAEKIAELLKNNAIIVDRKEAPACCQIIKLGEFSDIDLIIADPDFDGLLAAMKAVGINYNGMEKDAEAFDVRPKQSEKNMTELGWTAVRALTTLPPFNREKPEISQNAKENLFSDFLKAASGNQEAMNNLKAKVANYEKQVAEAKRLLSEKVTSPCKGVKLVDTVDKKERYDSNVLIKGIETEGIIVTVIRKDFGVIAKNHNGIQYTMAVVREYKEDLDLRTLIPEGMETSPEAGIISNTSFLLHCSEKVWNETILPNLKLALK